MEIIIIIINKFIKKLFLLLIINFSQDINFYTFFFQKDFFQIKI
jgi:hypothetical protein